MALLLIAATVVGLPAGLCNQEWPPEGTVLIDGPANLRDKPDGELVVELADRTEVTVERTRGAWVFVRGEQTSKPFEGWTHDANINIIRRCGMDTVPDLLEVSEDGANVIAAFGRNRLKFDVGVGQKHVFGTGAPRWPIGVFFDATEMTSGVFFLIGAEDVEHVRSLGSGRFYLDTVWRNGSIAVKEDFHCMMIRYRINFGKTWARRHVKFTEEFVDQTIREDAKECWGWSKMRGGEKVPLSPGARVELRGVTSDGKLIELGIRGRNNWIYLPAGDMSWRCLSRGSSCAG